jgi:hypothetical protein
LGTKSCGRKSKERKGKEGIVSIAKEEKKEDKKREREGTDQHQLQSNGIQILLQVQNIFIRANLSVAAVVHNRIRS